jgi:hypothetical protein
MDSRLGEMYPILNANICTTEVKFFLKNILNFKCLYRKKQNEKFREKPH